MTPDLAQFEGQFEGLPKPSPPTAAETSAGRSFPLGAAVLADGVNFSVFSREASRVGLLLFDDTEALRPTRTIDLKARMHRTYHYWHVFVPGIGAGQLYAYRASGAFAPEHGLRFDLSKALPDPYGRAVAVPDGYSRQMASQYGGNDAIAMKSVVVDPGGYDWEGDVPLCPPIARTIIYEMHVAGFTRHPSPGLPRVAPRSVAVLFARTAETSVPDEGLSATHVPTQIDVPVNQPARSMSAMAVSNSAQASHSDNWQWRCTAATLTSVVWRWLRDLTLASDRALAVAQSWADLKAVIATKSAVPGRAA